MRQGARTAACAVGARQRGPCWACEQSNVTTWKQLGFESQEIIFPPLPTYVQTTQSQDMCSLLGWARGLLRYLYGHRCGLGDERDRKGELVIRIAHIDRRANTWRNSNAKVRGSTLKTVVRARKGSKILEVELLLRAYRRLKNSGQSTENVRCCEKENKSVRPSLLTSLGTRKTVQNSTTSFSSPSVKC